MDPKVGNKNNASILIPSFPLELQHHQENICRFRLALSSCEHHASIAYLQHQHPACLLQHLKMDPPTAPHASQYIAPTLTPAHPPSTEEPIWYMCENCSSHVLTDGMCDALAMFAHRK